MGLSDDDQLRWRELAKQLRHDRRLAAQAARFGAVIGWRRDMAVARAGSAIPMVTWLPATVVASLGLAMVIAGGLGGGSALVIAGAGLLILILILTGAALIAIGIAGARQVHNQRGVHRPASRPPPPN